MIVSAFFFVKTDDVFYAPYQEPRTFQSPNKDIPTLTALIEYNVSAKGTFSAENPITITVCISNVNTSNLLAYYGELGFFGSVFDPSSSHYSESNKEQPGYIFLERTSDGKYIGTSTLIWHFETNVYTFLLPIPSLFNSPVTIPGNPSNNPPDLPTMHITGSQDTYNWKFNELTTKLTYILVGFSFLMLQPIIEAVLRLKRDD